MYVNVIFVKLCVFNSSRGRSLVAQWLEDGPLLPSDWSPDAKAFRCSSYGGVVGVAQ